MARHLGFLHMVIARLETMDTVSEAVGTEQVATPSNVSTKDLPVFATSTSLLVERAV